MEREPKNNYSVYIHRNTYTGKRYVGITSGNVKTRWNGGWGYENNHWFFSDIIKYGWINFEHRVIESGISKEVAQNLETDLILRYKTTHRNYGYNAVFGLGNNRPIQENVFIPGDSSRFISYINSNWLAPSDATKEMLDRYKIWKDTDKTEIVSRFVDCKLIPTQPQHITFNKVMFTLQQSLGYTVENGQQRFNKEMHRYRLIVSFDEDKITYEKIKKPLDNLGGLKGECKTH